MSTRYHTNRIVLLCACLLTGCMTPLPKNVTEPVYPFKTDGCSASPDFNFTQCCIEHDKAYWRGGTCAERRAADSALRQCIAERDREFTSHVYHAGVRLFGSPILPTPWRWGFGWPYGMSYTEADNCAAQGATSVRESIPH